MAIVLSRKQSMILGLGLLIAFFVISGIIITIKNRQTISIPSASLDKSDNQTTEHGLGFTLDNFHRSLVRDGKKLWDIKGVSGSYQVSSNTASIISPDLTVNRPSGERANIRASKALLTLTGSELTKAELFENVLVTYQEKTVLKTSRATFDNQASELFLPDKFFLTNPLFSLEADTLRGSLETQEFVASGGVKSIIQPQGK